MLKRLIIRSVLAYAVVVFLCYGLFGAVIESALLEALVIALVIRGGAHIVHFIPGFVAIIGKYGMMSILFKSIVGFILILFVLFAGAWLLLFASAFVGAGAFIRDVVESVQFDRGLIRKNDATEIWDI